MTAPLEVPSPQPRPAGPVVPLAELDAELERLLDFGTRFPGRRGSAWLSEDGSPDPGRPTFTYITARMTHVYCLGSLLGGPRDRDRDLARAGLAGLDGPLRDRVQGGWSTSIDPDGRPDGRKECYTHAFVVLAASSAADPYRGLNANMHAVEALLAAADATDDGALRHQALGIARRVAVDLGPAHGWRLPEHFDQSWVPLLEHHRDEPAHPFQPYGATVGHGLEWSRLLLDLEAALGDEAPDWLAPAASALFDRAVADGWDVDGAPGFVYTTDWSGQPVVRDRMYWVVCEAVAVAAALHRRHGGARYVELARTWWAYTEEFLVDRRLGSWHHQLDPENRPTDTVWPGKPDLYHAVQAVLLPRLPLAPGAALALREGGLDHIL